MAKTLILALFEPFSQVCKHLEQKRVTEMAPSLFPHLLPYLGMPYMALTQLFGSEPNPPLLAHSVVLEFHGPYIEIIRKQFGEL